MLISQMMLLSDVKEALGKDALLQIEDNAKKAATVGCTVPWGTPLIKRGTCKYPKVQLESMAHRVWLLAYQKQVSLLKKQKNRKQKRSTQPE